MKTETETETDWTAICTSVDILVRALMERMGKTLFFRSGGEPLILTEEQRELRKQGWSEKLLSSLVLINSQQN